MRPNNGELWDRRLVRSAVRRSYPEEEASLALLFLSPLILYKAVPMASTMWKLFITQGSFLAQRP
ncbi:MAG: hypothetical protein SWK76_17710 [Actinomycetota bacterium]|nr:hypothetical protein [Actinomycetota bacterium]